MPTLPTTSSPQPRVCMRCSASCSPTAQAALGEPKPSPEGPSLTARTKTTRRLLLTKPGVSDSPQLRGSRPLPAARKGALKAINVCRSFIDSNILIDWIINSTFKHSLNQKYNKYLQSLSKNTKSIQRHCLSKRHKCKRYQKIGDKHCLLQNTLQSPTCAVQLLSEYHYICAVLPICSHI